MRAPTTSRRSTPRPSSTRSSTDQEPAISPSGPRLAAATLLAAATAVGAPSVGGRPAAASAGDGDFRVTDPRITESSGLATSRAHRHTVWSVNDSGDSARVFAVDTRTGDTVGVHSFDAPVWDVEALAIGPDGRMFVGDIGDNTESRPFVRVFWFDEPPLGQTRGSWASWEFAYPDGPHNAEALLVDPRSGRLSIVTKDEPGAVYAASGRPSRAGVNRLTRVASAPPVVTDGVVLADGRVALRGYLRLSVYAANTWQLLSEQALPLQPQGETIAAVPGEDSVLVGSEGTGSLVRRVKLTGAPAGPPLGATAQTTASTEPDTPAATPTAAGPTPSAAATTAPAPRGAQSGQGRAAGVGLTAWGWGLAGAALAAVLAAGWRWRQRRLAGAGERRSPTM